MALTRTTTVRKPVGAKKRAVSRAARLPKEVTGAVHAAQSKKASDVVVLDLRKAGGFTDYFVICTGGSGRQIQAIADAVKRNAEEGLWRAARTRRRDRKVGMDSARLLRFRRAHLQRRLPRVLRAGAAVGQRRAARVCRAGLDALLAITLAPRCAACASVLTAPLDGPVCASCWSGVVPLIPPFCRTCGDPLPSWRVISAALEKCPRCRRGGYLFSAARAAGNYEGTLRDILHAFKYDSRRSLARPLGVMLRTAGANLLADAHCVVPVPLHPWRRLRRGFNQAEVLAVQTRSADDTCAVAQTRHSATDRTSRRGAPAKRQRRVHAVTVRNAGVAPNLARGPSRRPRR